MANLPFKTNDNNALDSKYKDWSLPDLNQIQSESSTEDSKFTDWQLPSNIIQEGEEPSNIRKFQYGWAKEDMVLGDVWDLGKAWVGSWDDDTFEESRQQVLEEKRKALFEDYPEFEDGRYDSDKAVMAGSLSTMIADPVYILMPWARAAQAGKFLGKGGMYLAGLGAGVGTGDSIIRQAADTGEIDWTQVGYTAGAGAALSPVAMVAQKGLGAVANKMFPNLFKSTREKNAIQEIMEKKFIEKNSLLNKEQLNKVVGISDEKLTKQLFTEVSDTTNYFQNFIKPVIAFKNQLNDVTDIATLLKSKKLLIKNLEKILAKQKKGVFLTKGTGPKKDWTFSIYSPLKSLKGKSLKNATIKEIKDNYKAFEKEMLTKSNKAREMAVKSHTDYTEHLAKRLYQEMGYGEKLIKAIVSAGIRPVIGAGAGGAFGTLGGANDDTLEGMMWGGAVLGGFHKITMRGGIKGVPVAIQNKMGEGVKQNFVQLLDRYLRINLATTTATRLSQRNTVMDGFSVEMFPRFTDSIRTNIWGKPSADFLGRPLKSKASESIGLLNRGDSIEGRAIDQVKKWFYLISNNETGGILKGANRSTQDEAIKIVRGFEGETSKEAQSLANRIITYLTDFKKYYNDVGIVSGQDLAYYFPRKLNFALIESSVANKKEFLKGVAKAYMNIGEAKNMKSAMVKAENYYKNSKKLFTDEIISEKQLNLLGKGRIKSKLNKDGTIKDEGADILLPISNHIKHQRTLQGTYAKVESQFDKYLINDVPTVLSDLVQSSVKSVEFARSFGADGRLLRGFTDKLKALYKGAGYTDSKHYQGHYNFSHKGDVDHMRDSINGYFGMYGKRGTETTRGIAAVLSTLANFNLMERVTIANIGDLSQGFQNSRHFSSVWKAIPGFFGRGIAKQADDIHGGIAAKAINEAYHTDVATKIGGVTDKRGFIKSLLEGNILNAARVANQGFFKVVGLNALTKASRRYTYNVAAIDIHMTSKELAKTAVKKGIKDLNKLNDRASLEHIQHLTKTGVLKLTKDGKRILNSKDILRYGAFKNLKNAEQDVIGRVLINRAGNIGANRDAIIPQVGNRLLFTQSRNPLLRLVGQYSSWAMAKSAQTNAMIQRIESGEGRTLVGMLGALVMFGGIKDLRNFATHGEFTTKRALEKGDENFWLANALQFSGNLGWLPTTGANTIMYRKNSTPVEFFPGIQMFNDYVDMLMAGSKTVFSKTTGDLDLKAYDEFIRGLYETGPLPIVRGILDRIGLDGWVYRKDINYADEINKEKLKSKKKFVFSRGGLTEKSRQLFSTGDVVKETSFNDAFAQARNEKKELFDFNDKTFTTKKDTETDQQYKNFLGVTKLSNEVILQDKIEEPADKKSLQEVLIGTESSGDYRVVNTEGYMGAYQFGEARLEDYKNATGEDFDRETFLGDNKLQDKIYEWHINDIKNFIKQNKLDKYIGTEIKNVPVTLNGLLAVAHLGGREGMKQFVLTSGEYNKEDKYGTTLLDYLKRFNLNKGGAVVRQLLNGGGSTYRRNARESYIASSNKPTTTSSNTGSSIGPAGMGGGSFKPDDKPENYGTATQNASETFSKNETVVSEETNLMDLLKTDEEVSDVVKKSRDKDNSIFKPIQLGKNVKINPLDTSIEWQTQYGDFGVDVDPLKSAVTATYGFEFKKGGLMDRKRS